LLWLAVVHLVLTFVVALACLGVDIWHVHISYMQCNI
jgi:hypothetical protein